MTVNTIVRITIVLVSMTSSISEAMNLVPNPSFETFSLCPVSLSQINRAVPWDTPTTGSPDYYNACATSSSGVSVPSNTFGSQAARTGVAYAGFLVRPINETREYSEISLVQPLLTGQIIQVQFWVSLSDDSRDAIDRIGAYFSNGSVGPVTNSLALPFTPQVESPGNIFLTDKTSWIQISGTFTAAGGEDHIVIGNFHDNSATNVQQLSGSFPGSYYYIDDISAEIVGQTTPSNPTSNPTSIPAISRIGLLLLAIFIMASGITVLSLQRK